MKRLNILITTLLCGLPFYGNAQQVSLKDAVEQALRSHPKVAAKEAALKMARTEYEKRGHAYIPEIEAEAGMQRNFLISATPVPAKMFYPDAPEGEMYPAKFGTKYSGSAGLRLTYDLFQPERMERRREERYRVEVADWEVVQQREQLTNRVRLDYAAVLLAQKQLQLCREDTASAGATLRYTALRMEKGEASREELLSAQMDRNGAFIRWENASAVLHKAKQSLLADMGVAPNEELVEELQLNDSLEEVLEALEREVEGKWTNAEAAKQQLLMRMAKSEWKRAKWGFLPTLSLTGYYGSGYYGPRLHLAEGKYWYGSSYLGLKLTFPITKIADEVSELKRSRAAYQKARWEAQEEELEQQLKANSYRVDMQRAKRTMYLEKESARLANRRFQIEQSAFDLGESYPARLKEQERQRFASEVDYIQSVYDYFVAMANYLLALRG